MKLIGLILILFSSYLSSAQDHLFVEKEISEKASSYFEAWDGPTISSLADNDKIYLQNYPDISVEQYCVSNAYKYYAQLVAKYPHSINYNMFLYKKGLTAVELGNLNKDVGKFDEAIRCFSEVIEKNTSHFYTKLCLYQLATLYSHEKNCEATKQYIKQLYQIPSDFLNEYQNDYIDIGIKRMIQLCEN